MYTFNSIVSLILNYLMHNFKKIQYKGYDEKKRHIIIYNRLSRSYTFLNLSEIVYDSFIISNISPASASIIGYHYGLHYNEMNRSNKANPYSFTLNIKGNYDYYLLSMSRNKNVNIGSISNSYNALNVNPCEIICRKELIEKFHPIQACFIGMLAGMKASKAG